MTKQTMLELAERCEAATGPDRYLDSYIWVSIGGQDNAGTPNYTASLDAAMTLAVEGISAPDVLRHAIQRCTRYGAPTFIEALPRFVASEWVRVRASGGSQK